MDFQLDNYLYSNYLTIIVVSYIHLPMTVSVQMGFSNGFLLAESSLKGKLAQAAFVCLKKGALLSLVGVLH